MTLTTAIGINNEGSLAFSYELEDTDQVAGADVYNGQHSVLWTNLRQAYFEEIKAMYQQLRSNGALSYADTERRFEEHQSKWPEAIFNEDAFFKYLQPLIEDNSAAYLSMLQGSKAEQRKWWLYNRYRYLDSKYNAGDALSDVITVRGYAKADITVTPYADIYASVKYGSYLVQQRALRGNSYTLICPLDNVNDTEIYIYSASQLKDVGDLSGLMVGYAEFALATKLQSLKLGDASADYSNTNLTDLHLGNNVLLRTLDVRNCPNLTQAVDVSGCSNLEHVYFDGTGITGLLLPVGGILKTLHLPASITNLTIRNQASLTDLSIPSYAGISTLRLENVSSAVDSKAILQAIPANSRVRLIGIDWAAGDADTLMAIIALLDTMRGLDESGNNTDMAQVSGTISVDTVTGAQLAEIAGKYPDIRVAYEHITSNLYFYSDDGSTLLYTQAIVDGGNGTYSGSTPSKASTAQYTFSFAGWSKKPGGTADSTALQAVTADRSVYAAFTSSIRKYTVYFYNGSTLLQRVDNVPYGSSATYTGDTPTKTGVDDPENWPFTEWIPSGKNITGDTSCYAQFQSPLKVKEITDSWETIIANIDNGTYKAKYKIGNYKPLDLGAEGIINMQIAGFDADDMSDDSGKAPITFIGKELLKTATVFKTGGTGNGWDDSTLRNYMKTTVKPLIEDVVRDRIVEVRKYQVGNTGGVNATQITNDDVWIPMYRNLTSDFASEIKPSGIYKVLFPDTESRRRAITGSQVYGYWWERSKDSRNYQSAIGSNGNSTVGENLSKYYVCLGFCLRGPREITDSWEEIFAAEADGTYKEKYQISDYKPLDLGSEGVINMQIAGFDVEDKADGTGKAPITWAGRELLKTDKGMNPALVTKEDGTYQEGTGSIGGWEKCFMRKYLKETIKPLIPENVQNQIVEVVKNQGATNISGSSYLQYTNDDIWIPNLEDIRTLPYGKKYAMLFTCNIVLQKGKGKGLYEWYLREAYAKNLFRYISFNGKVPEGHSGDSASSRSICLFFCT